MTIDLQTQVWEHAACDWCGSTAARLLFEGPDRLDRLPGEFRMAQCEACGLIRQHPRLAWESLKHYYSGEYYRDESTLRYRMVKDESNPLRRWHRGYGSAKRLRAVERHAPGGRLLDVGCGMGLFLEAAHTSGRWEVAGIEPTEVACNIVRQGLGVPVHMGTLVDYPAPDKPFDLITLWNVLEHVPDPTDTLGRCNAMLADGGVLSLTIPNVEGVGKRVFGKYWVGWDLPRHLYIFPRPVLETMLNQMGFELIDARCLSTSYALLGHSLDFWSQSWEDRFPWLRSAMLRIYHSLPVRVALLVPLWFLDRNRQTTLLTVFARKVGPATR